MLSQEQLNAAYNTMQQNEPMKPATSTVRDRVMQARKEREKPAGSILGNLGNAIISSERGFANTLAGSAAVSGVAPKTHADIQAAEESQTGLDDMNVKLGHAISAGKQQGKDTSRMEELYKENTGRIFNLSDITGGAIDKTAKQIYGEAGGVALDIATAGTLAKGVPSMKMLKGAVKVQNVGEAMTKGKKVIDAVKKVGTGSAIGYGYDVTQKMQDNKPMGEVLTPGMGTAIGALIPGAGILGQGIKELGNMGAPKIINSLIKPLAKDFSYGKNPGRVVAKKGIIANDLDELATKIGEERGKTGAKIGKINKLLEGKEKLSLENITNPFDKAMNIAAKNNNPTLLKRLQETKRAISEKLELGLDDAGEQVIQSQGARELSSVDFSDAFKIKKDIGDMTQWTGNASDDKIVNKALKQAYGITKEEINNKAAKANPELGKKLRELNEDYADLTSAEVATKYRDVITSRQNVLSLGGKVMTVAGLMTALASGQGLSLATIAAGVGGAILDKALGSTAVKTRIASMLSKEAPTSLQRMFNTNPKFRDAIYKAFNAPANEDVKKLLNKANDWAKTHAGIK